MKKKFKNIILHELMMKTINSREFNQKEALG